MLKMRKLVLNVFYIVAEWHLVVRLQNYMSRICDVISVDVPQHFGFFRVLQCQAASLVTRDVPHLLLPNSRRQLRFHFVLFWSWGSLSPVSKINCCCIPLKGTCTSTGIYYIYITDGCHYLILSGYLVIFGPTVDRLSLRKRATGWCT